MAVFKITYIDPDDEEEKVVFYEEEDSLLEDGTTITAEEWADDWGYTLADKGWYSVERIT